jgi:hypothetical protein
VKASKNEFVLKLINIKAQLSNGSASIDNFTNRALIAATVYFLALFSLGFALGAIRVMIVAPRLGVLVATATEVPAMLVPAYFICRWVIANWRIPPNPLIRWAMTLWFLILLFLFELILGLLLFGRTIAEQLESLKGLGLSAQIGAALLPVLISKDE